MDGQRRSGRRDIRERFAPEVVTARLLDCYARLMAERGVHVPRLVEEIEATSQEIADTARRLAETVAEPPSHRIEGARTRAVLAFATRSCPTRHFSLRGPMRSTAPTTSRWSSTRRTGARSVRATASAPRSREPGLDSEDAADLLALATPATVALEASLARGASAVLTAHSPRPPFAALARVDAQSVSLLAQTTRAA